MKRKEYSWAYKDVEEFFTLTNKSDADLVINPGGSLARIFNDSGFKRIEAIIGDTSRLGTTKTERYDNYLAKVKTNPFGKWLFKNDNFLHALKLFQKKQTPRNPGYCIELAELQFYHLAAMTGFCIDHKINGKSRPNPTSREVEQANKTVIKLQESLSQGVRFNDYEKTNQLAGLLVELRETLTSATRKPRSDENTINRQFVRILSMKLLRCFGEVSPRIVISLAAVFDYNVDATAIESQIKAARIKFKAENRETVVNALVNGQKKTA